jgi:peptide/nickel transport system substrate-binding protein
MYSAVGGQRESRTWSRRRSARAAGSAALALALACGGPSEQSAPAAAAASSEAAAQTQAAAAAGQPERGDWLVLHQLSDPENLNPLTASDVGATELRRWVMTTLLRLDPETLQPAPYLARELPELSEDKLSYTFRLREGVTFSDGVPLTAEDLLFTLKAIVYPGVQAPHIRNYFESVRDAVALDPLSVRIDLKQRYFRNDIVLGDIEVMPRHYYDPENLTGEFSVAQVASPEALGPEQQDKLKRFAKQFNEDYNRRILGSGPFALLDPEKDIVTGERITLTRRADYWGADDPRSGDAFVQRIVYRMINDPEAALASFKRSDLDRMTLSPVQHRRPDTEAASFTERANKRERVAPQYTYVAWNTGRELFKEGATRRALTHFVDKQAIVKSVLLGLGEPIEGPVSKNRPEYNSSLKPYPYDPEKGKQLLAELGWKDSDGDGILDREIDGKRVPFRFEVISNSGNESRRNAGLALVDQLKRAGIDASFRQLDWSIMLERVDKRDYDAVILGWRTPPTPPDLYQIWHSSQAVQSGSNNSVFRNAELDKLLEAYREEFEFAKRKPMIDRMQQIIYDEQPYTFLYAPLVVDGWDRRFEGVTWYAKLQDTEMGEWWVPQSAQRYQ